MNDRKCLQCFEELKGRSDQKFCNDQCRSTYNNVQYFDTNIVVKTINRILKKNHSILQTLNVLGKSSVNKSVLENKGYYFEYYTQVVSGRTNNIHHFCYDHGYRQLDSNKLVLMQRDIGKEPD